MSSYRLRHDRKYKKRRSLVITVIVLSVLAISMAVYLFLNRDSATGSANPSDGAQTASTQSSTTPSDSSTAVATDTDQPADSTEVAVSTPNTDLNGVETKDHGYLPKVGTAAKSGKMEELQKLISDNTKNLPGDYGVTYIDLATGEMVNVNDKIEYIAASTSKLPVNVLLYKNIEEGKVKLEDKLVYKQEDMEPGTGIIQSSAFGTEYTVRETSKLAIRKSDNCGVNMLIRLVDIVNVRKYMADLGGQVIYGKTHRSCPYDMALIAQDLYKLYLNNEEVYGELINNMENTDWHDRIDAKLPKEVKVAHKIGNQTRTRNDVGIVFATHPYILSVMTDNVELDPATKSIADLSKKIYDFEEAYAVQTAK
ncbi:MAG TPA: serine hydrolase [Ruminiclostridium sp.]